MYRYGTSISELLSNELQAKVAFSTSLVSLKAKAIRYRNNHKYEELESVIADKDKKIPQLV